MIPELGRSPGEGNGSLLQYSFLENPMDGRVSQATVRGVAKSWTRRSDVTAASLIVMPGVGFLVLTNNHRNVRLGTSVVVPWLRTQAPKTGSPGSIHGQETRSHMPQLRPGAPNK